MRTTLNALAFESDAEAGLLDLQRELRAHTYRPGRLICFVTDGPKPREVFAADFRDRIAHHLLVSRLQPIFEPAFNSAAGAIRINLAGRESHGQVRPDEYDALCE